MHPIQLECGYSSRAEAFKRKGRLFDTSARYNQESLPELQGLMNLKVDFHHATKEYVVIHNITLPKQSTVGDVINELKTKVELSHSNAELRLLEVFYHRIYKIFPPNEKIENINDQYWTLRAEEIPEEEKNLGPYDRLIHVYHFNKDSAQSQMQVKLFGEPFFLVIHKGETLGEVKVRIQKKLQVPDEEFAKWKFAFRSWGRKEYLQDSDIVFALFQRRDVYGAQDYLGLEHSYTAPKLSYAANQMQGTPDIRAVSLTATSMSGKSSSTLLENLKNLLAGFSSTKGTEKSTSSSNMSESSLPPNPPSLQQHREVLKNYLASSLESIEQTKAFDEIQRITLLLLQHSTSSLERTILKDLASRLEAFKVIVPTTKSSTENVRAQLTSLSGKKADVGTRLGQAQEHCDFLEAKFRKYSEEEMEIEKQIVHLMKQKEGFRISKNSLALELEKFSEQVTKDVEEWKVISEESEEANNKWLQVRETLAQPNLSWKLFKQNLEQCEKGA